ncbi:hypothetical protein B296_00036449 [Ensete ventricosum]|uniref:Uncharacterized protein n=1 Tax=Ensete ventricosum TaxID=4639 RepID=A0A426Z1Y0_ENSVE|nr:hypothetical protein B296_00036449 [Ensete ventricosum]
MPSAAIASSSLLLHTVQLGRRCHISCQQLVSPAFCSQPSATCYYRQLLPFPPPLASIAAPNYAISFYSLAPAVGQPVFFDDYDAIDSSDDEGKCFHSSLYSSLLCCLLLLPSSSSIAAAAAPPYHSRRPYLYCHCILCFPSSSSTVATASHCPAASIATLFIPLCIATANRHYNSPGHCCIPRCCHPLLPLPDDTMMLVVSPWSLPNYVTSIFLSLLPL